MTRVDKKEIRRICISGILEFLHFLAAWERRQQAVANSRRELIVSNLYHGGKPQQRDLNLTGHGVFVVIALRWQFCLFLSYEDGRDA